MSLEGSTIAQYAIQHRLGGGGMGVVYKAFDTKLRRTVVLKFLPPELSADEEANRRFMLEAQAASALNHPNVCTVHGIETTGDGRLYIVMPFYEGQTLKYRIKDGPIEVDRARDVARQIAGGLDAAHRHGIIHRDVKPANIMVTDDDRVIILDFGLAKLTVGLDLTKTGSTLGTVPYMSPEQIRGQSVDHHTDLWSLGVVLYEMLAGRRPFAGDYDQALAYQIVNVDPPPLDTNESLASLVTNLLEKEPANRIESAATVMERLSSTVEQGNGRQRESLKKTSIYVAVMLALLAGLALVFTNYYSGGESNSSRRASLVVLPFANEGDADDEYFAVGVSDEITTRLTAVSALRVIPTGSARKYRSGNRSPTEIGMELNVDYLLEGSVRWARREGGDSRAGLIHGSSASPTTRSYGRRRTTERSTTFSRSKRTWPRRSWRTSI